MHTLDILLDTRDWNRKKEDDWSPKPLLDQSDLGVVSVVPLK